jgi:hypothetical protein
MTKNRGMTNPKKKKAMTKKRTKVKKKLLKRTKAII